jgi:PAS domain S-box-containing protein
MQDDFKDHFIIEMIEPLEINKSAIGLDVATEDNRREAAIYSAKNGLPSLTSKIQLVQSGEKTAGFLFYLPVYKKVSVPKDEESRLKNIVGWAYVPFNASQLFSAIESKIYRNLDLSVSDISSVDNPQTLISFKSNDRAENSTEKHISSRKLSIFGRDFLLNGKLKGKDSSFKSGWFLLLFFLLSSFSILSFFKMLLRAFQQDKIKAKEDLMRWQETVLNSAEESIISATPDGIISTFNEAASKMLGYRPDEMIGINTPAIIHDLSEVVAYSKVLSQELGRNIAPGFEVFIAKALLGKSDVREWTYIRKDGSRFPVQLRVTAMYDSQNKIIGFLGVAHDLTKQKVTESELNQLLSAINQSAIVSTTDKKGKIIKVNDNFCKVSGYTKEELIGSDHRIVNSGVHPKEFFEKIWSTILSGQIWIGEIQNKNKQGDFYWVYSVIAPLFDENKQIDRFVSIRFDISEGKRAENKLMHSAQMATLGEMAGGVAHEVNNPLAIIVGKSNQLRRRMEQGNFETSKIIEGLITIENTSERIAKIVKGLRTFSRSAESDPMVPVQARKIVESTIELCSQRFKSHSVALNVLIETDCNVQCREVQISQILMNLVNNSFDAIEMNEEKWVEVKVFEKNKTVHFVVTDSGLGIPKQVVDKMMQPFFTTKEVGKGTGLGLSISKSIAEEHHGSLSYDFSSKNTRFILVLPESQPEKGV